MKQKKIDFLNTKLAENIGRPKELWNCLKTLDLASIKSPFTNISLKTKDNITNIDDKKRPKIFKKFTCTLVNNLVANLPPHSFRFG